MIRPIAGAMNRREFIKTGLTAAAVLPIANSVLRPGVAHAEEKLVTDLPDQAPMVQALQYTNVSDKPDQNCTGCQFYTPGGNGTGKCQLIPIGLVTDGGWCASFVKKV